MRLRPTRRTASAGLLLTASVVYNDWVLQFFLPTGLHQRDSYVSELFAADQPYRVLFSLVEIACAGLVVTGGALAWSILPGGRASAGGAATVAFGVFSIADVLMPLRCAPSVERGCPEGSLWHTTTSGMVHFALFASMALFISASRHGRPPWDIVRRWGPWLLAFSMTAAILTVGPFFGHPGGHGLAQRIHLTSVGAWFALLAVAILRYGAGDGPSSCRQGDVVGKPRRARRCRLPRRRGRWVDGSLRQL